METKTLTVVANEVQDESVKFTLINEEETAVYELVLFKKDYDKETKEWNTTEETTERYFTQLQDKLGIMSDDNLEELTGKSFELYVNDDNGRAYFEAPKGLEKPTLDQDGDLEQAEIIDIVDYESKRVVIVDVEGKRYGVNFGFSNWVAPLEKYVVNQGKKAKQMARFKDITGSEWDDCEDLKGLTVNVEFTSFQTASGKIPYIELKKIKRKK